MGQTTDNLKQIAQIRKAVQPLVELMQIEANAEVNARLKLLEETLVEVLKRDTTIEVKAPDVKVDMDTATIIEAIEKQNKTLMQKSEPTPVATEYEPHDQGKKGVYQYSGFVRSDGAWYIQRVAKGEQRYSKGNGDYATAWEGKSKLKYGYLDESD